MAEQRGSGLRSPEGDDRLSALLTNAIRAVSSAVQGTPGSKGLHCMRIDSLGDVTITNDGSTLLDRTEVSHPAAQLLIHAAKAREREVGDGTTTTTLLAGASIGTALQHVSPGVPVVRLLDGMAAAIERALVRLDEIALPPADLGDSVLRQAALIAGRGEGDLADLTVRARARWAATPLPIPPTTWPTA